MQKQSIKISDVWKDVLSDYIKINGNWEPVVAKYVKANGVWKESSASKYGVVWYKPDINSNVVKGAVIRSLAEFNSLCTTESLPEFSSTSSWSATIDNGNVTVTNSSTNIIVGITIGWGVTSIPDLFLWNCESLSMPIVFPDNITSMGHGVLGHCYDYNLPIKFSNNITSIGASFLCGYPGDAYGSNSRLSKFNQTVSFPALLSSFPRGFLKNNGAFNQSISIPTSTTALESFAYNWTVFNQPVVIPNGVTSMDSCFYRITKFNQNVTIPNSISSITSFFFYQVWDFVSTINFQSVRPTVLDNETLKLRAYDTSPAYTNGIKIKGTYANDWKTALPDVLSPYAPSRKLIIVS